MRLGLKIIKYNECLKSFVRIWVKHKDGYIHKLQELNARLCAQPLDKQEKGQLIVRLLVTVK